MNEETQMMRPQMKMNAAPLTEADKYDFLPYIDRGAAILPSEQNTWKTDERAQAFMKALASGTDMSDTDWSGINLKGADLSGADLCGLKLSKANLMNTNLSGAKLEWTDLSYAYCENTDFSNADMKNTQMKGVFYKNCNIDGADMDEETRKYLQSVEWFINQIETGKIKLEELPQDQLNYLDLRTIDMSQVKIEEGIDLSALVLTGVNLSGVYIPKGHFLNMALMAWTKQKVKLIMQRTQRTLDLMYQRLKEERKEKIKAYGAMQAKTQQVVRDYALSMGRPRVKITPVSGTADTDTKKESFARVREEKSTDSPMRKLMRQGKKVKVQKTNLKKRA